MSDARTAGAAGRAQGARRARPPLAPNLTFGLIILAVLVVSAAIGLVWTPYDPNLQDFTVQLQGPTLAHPLGTDGFGRDTLSRLMRGAGTSLLVGVISVSIGSVLGLLFGAISGYAGGL